jgi:hypothetical protein
MTGVSQVAYVSQAKIVLVVAMARFLEAAQGNQSGGNDTT